MIRAPIFSAVAAALLLGLAAAAPAAAEDAASSSTPAATPRDKGEFDDYCVMGLSEGQNIKTDCSVTWTDEDGKVYCFSSEKSKAAFLKDPAGNIKKAREFEAAKAEAAAKGAKDFKEADVNDAVKKTIDERTKDGAFVFHDPKLNADLNLIFDKIKIVRGMEGYGWFANVIFSDKDEPKKQYAIDFWFKPEGQELKLMDIRVQKGPKRDGDSYYMITRLPVAWWWLPVQEHPGDMEVTRAWHVMSAIHNYIANHKDKDGNSTIKDDKTGESIPARICRDPPAGAPSEEEWRIFRLHRLPQARQPGRILRHRLLGEREDRQARGRQRQDAQGPGAGGRHLDPGAALHLRRHGFRHHQLDGRAKANAARFGPRGSAPPPRQGRLRARQRGARELDGAASKPPLLLCQQAGWPLCQCQRIRRAGRKVRAPWKHGAG